MSVSVNDEKLKDNGKFIVEYSNISTIAFDDYQSFCNNLKELGFSEKKSLSCSDRVVSPLYSDILNSDKNPNSQIFSVDFVDWESINGFKEEVLLHPNIFSDPSSPIKELNRIRNDFPEIRNKFAESIKKTAQGNNQQKCLTQLNLSSNRFFYINLFQSEQMGEGNNDSKQLNISIEIHYVVLLSIEVVCDKKRGFGILLFNFVEFDYSSNSIESSHSIRYNYSFSMILLKPIDDKSLSDTLRYALFRNIRFEYEQRKTWKDYVNRLGFKIYPEENTPNPNYYSGINDNGHLENTLEGYYGVVPAILSDKECEAALGLKYHSIKEYISDLRKKIFGEVSNNEFKFDYLGDYDDPHPVFRNNRENSTTLSDLTNKICKRCKAYSYDKDKLKLLDSEKKYILDSTITIMKFLKRDNCFHDTYVLMPSFKAPSLFNDSESIITKHDGIHYSYTNYHDKNTYVIFFWNRSSYLMDFKMSDLFCIGQYISLLLRYYRLFMIENTINDDNFDSEIDIFRKHYDEFINIKMRIQGNSISEHNEVNDLYYLLNKDTAPFDKIEDIHSYFELRIESLDKKYQTEKSKKTDKTNTVLALISILGISSAVKSIADIIHDIWVTSPNPNGRFWGWALGVSAGFILLIIFYFSLIPRKIKTKMKRKKHERR